MVTALSYQRQALSIVRGANEQTQTPWLALDVAMHSENEWDVPTLDLDMQAESLPEPVTKWGVIARTLHMPGTYHFYTDDYKFRALWGQARAVTAERMRCGDRSELEHEPRDAQGRRAVAYLSETMAGSLLAALWRAHSGGYERGAAICRAQPLGRAQGMAGLCDAMAGQVRGFRRVGAMEAGQTARGHR